MGNYTVYSTAHKEDMMSMG